MEQGPRQKKIDTGALDIARLYDSVWHKGLMVKSKSFGIEYALLKFLKSYRTNRSWLLCMAKNLRNIPSVQVFPQGSILRPTLWNTYVNGLLDAVPKTVAYADDILHSSKKCFGFMRSDDSSYWSTLWQIAIEGNVP